MIDKIKILYLYSELVGYQIPILKEYVSQYNAEVHVMSWDKKKIKPYVPELIEGVTYYKRSEYNNEQILSLTLDINPDIIYISGWMDKGYLYVTKRMKKQNVPIVTAFDDIWKGTLRQKVGAFIFPFYFKKFFTHAWVAGAYQFEFAKKMGFKNREIVFDMLSADTSQFKYDANSLRKENTQKSFLYVGNFRKVKGVDILINAFEIYKSKYNGTWNLICVGNGELEPSLKECSRVKLFPFSTSKEIIEISKNANVFILPSRNDQWGVVVHEFACLGMPLLLAENVGAKASFFINGFNGYGFNNDSAEELAKQMYRFEKLDNNELLSMGENSYALSKKINVATSAANFISILKQYNG
ncbi:glycosyltransferase [Flavobacterium sp. B11]|uniref:glycosyltransferase family 4 protein n=1 Tax=Flavobacterium movens TaxID=214860 RepID=UPI0031D19C70